MSAIREMFSQPLVHSVGWGLIHSVWQAAGLALLLAVVLRLLRRRSPQARYVVACASLGLMVCLPVLTQVLTAPTEAAPPLPARVEGPALPSIPVARVGRVEEPAAVGVSGGALEGLWDAVGRAAPYVFCAWLLGVLALSLWRAVGWARVYQLGSSGVQPVGGSLSETFAALARRVGVSRPVRLMRSAGVRAPMTIGWLRGAVLLPAGALVGLTPDQLRAVLAHELAHIRRYDYLVNLVQTAVETLGFYHPGVWWASARIREAREECCDDLAAAACGDRVLYARALIAVEESQQPPPGLAVGAGGGSLLGRIRRLTGSVDQQQRHSAGWLAGAMALATFAAVGIVAPMARSSGPVRREVVAPIEGEAPATAAARVVNAYKVADMLPSIIKHNPGLKTKERALEWLATLVRREVLAPPGGKKSDGAVAPDAVKGLLVIVATPKVQATAAALLENVAKHGHRRIVVVSHFVRLDSDEEAKIRAWLGEQAGAKAVVIDAAKAAELLRRLKALKSARALTNPKILLGVYTPGNVVVGQFAPMRLENLRTGSVEKIQARTGVFLNVEVHVGADGKGIVVRAESELRKFLSAGPPPTTERAHARADAAVPPKHALLIRMPVRRYRLVGFRDPAGGGDREFTRRPAEREAAPRQFVYVVITPALEN